MISSRPRGRPPSAPGDPHARHVAVVVGAPDVDGTVVLAADLVDVVGDVRRVVGPLAVRAPQHAVLVVPVGGGAQPQRAVVLVDVAAEALDRGLDVAALVELPLGEELVHVHAEVGQRRAHSLEHQLDAALGEIVRLHVGRAVDPLRQLGHVVAAVAVLRRLLAPGARPDRLAEALHLAAGVVHVVLALHTVARAREDAGERVAVRRVAGRRDRHRPGRVRAHELEVHVLATRPGAVPVARLDQRGERVEVPAVGHEEVEEAGAGDLHALDVVPEPIAEHVAEPLGHGARRLAQRWGEQHRGVGRVVAEVRARRPVELQPGTAAVPGHLCGGLLDGGCQARDGVHVTN